ncbi:hypothetical protein BYT27DRAFT_6546569 [Phlegmacium glaucopus]|nr:hypothetical protein BYT27DRAFT_6546569 [Phlegmacium glaucopus]
MNLCDLSGFESLTVFMSSLIGKSLCFIVHLLLILQESRYPISAQNFFVPTGLSGPLPSA